MAGRKRKAEAARVLEDEADRPLYSAFRGAANSLSQFYALAGAHQKLSFQAGERDAMEKLYRWILQQHENGLRTTVSDIASHIQHEIEYGGEDALASPRPQNIVQNLQAPFHTSTASTQQASPSLFAQANLGSHSQHKNSLVFSTAPSAPIRPSLQPYQAQQGGVAGYFGDGTICTGNQEPSSAASNDSSMDMHSDSPAREPY